MLGWLINFFKQFCSKKEEEEEKIIKEFSYKTHIPSNYSNNIFVDNLKDITEIIKSMKDMDLKILSKDDIINCLKKLYSEMSDKDLFEIDHIVFDSHSMGILKITNFGKNRRNVTEYLVKQYFFKYESQCN